jgi:hypothetical protein
MSLLLDQFVTSAELVTYWDTPDDENHAEERLPILREVSARYSPTLNQLKAASYSEKLDILATIAGIEIVMRRKAELKHKEKTA